MEKEHSIAIYFWLLFVPLFWGGAFVAAEHVITEIPPITAAALRFGTAGDLFFIGGLLCWVIHGLLGKVAMRCVTCCYDNIDYFNRSFLLGVASLFEEGLGDVLHMSEQAKVEMSFMIICSSVIVSYCGIMELNKLVQVSQVFI